MGKKAGVDLYDYKFFVGAKMQDPDVKGGEEFVATVADRELKTAWAEEKHPMEGQCTPDLGCFGWYSILGLPGCCCRDDSEGMFWRKQHWREELYEAMENECLFMSITSLLIIDVMCILSEFVVHDKHFKESVPAHWAGLIIKCTSLSILTVFQIENCTILFALQEQFFWHLGHKIDFVVIPLSIVMETQVEADVGGLLVILRFWRLIRVAHGVWEGNQKKKGGEEEEEDAEIPEHLREHYADAEKAIKEGKSSKDAAHDHHVAQGGDSEHFHAQEHHDENAKHKWTDEMHEHYKVLTAHMEDWEEEEPLMIISQICPKYRIKMHEVLDQQIVHNVISILLVCDVLIVIIEFVVHDDHFLESHLCHEMGFYFTSASLSILAFFQAEALMQMNATGKFLFEYYGHFLDCIIIPLSIVLEFLLQGGATSLLIMLRLWRLVRIMHGVFTADEEKGEAGEKERESKREESLRHAHHIVCKQKSIDAAKMGSTTE